MSETIDEIYREMKTLYEEIHERNKRLDALMARAAAIVNEHTTAKREPVHHVAVADPAKAHMLTGTLPPNVLPKN